MYKTIRNQCIEFFAHLQGVLRDKVIEVKHFLLGSHLAFPTESDYLRGMASALNDLFRSVMFCRKFVMADSAVSH